MNRMLYISISTFLGISGCVLDYSLQEMTSLCLHECMTLTACEMIVGKTAYSELQCESQDLVCCGPSPGTDLDTDSDTDADTDTDTDTDKDLDTESGERWVTIPGGTFMMGSTAASYEKPVHEVTVPTFQMMRTEVTVAEYQGCVDDGVCTAPEATTGSNWGVAGRENHPVNHVDWQQANIYCKWAGGRLPSEAEGEYAARGGGQDITYPWGNEAPSCEYTVMKDGGNGCGQDRTWPVCSRTAGNTPNGLCDMAGNVWEWVQDWHHSRYDGAPSEGTAWTAGGGSYRVIRGGGYSTSLANSFRVAYRTYCDPERRVSFRGIRCARSGS